MYIQPTRVSRYALGDDQTDFIGQAESQVDQALFSAAVAETQAAAAQVLASNAPFTTIAGVCIPTSADVLERTKELQRQINRALVGLNGGKVAGAGLIGVDGKPGGQTNTALNKLGAARVLHSSLGGSLDCGTIGFDLDSFTSECQQFADGKGVSASVGSPPPSSTPAFFDASTGKVKPQGAVDSVLDQVKALSTIEQLSLGGAAIGIGLLLFTKPKKGKKRR